MCSPGRPRAPPRGARAASFRACRTCRPPSEVRESQRREHRECAEEECGEDDEPRCCLDAVIAECACEHMQALWRLAALARNEHGCGCEAERRDADRAECPADAENRGDAAEYRSEQRPGDG